MPFKAITLHVSNASDTSSVAGAKIFIDGTINFDPTQFSVVTDLSGNASFSITSNLSFRVMQVTADGFQSNSQLIDTSSFLPQSIHVSLSPVSVQKAIVQFQFVPAVGGIVWTIVTSESGVSLSDGTSQTLNPVIFGTYTVTASLANYQALTTSIVVNGQTDPYTLTLIGNADPSMAQLGNTNGDSTPITTTPTATVSQVTTEPPAVSEYTYPNTDFDKYFTITGARMYIGNLFIDELNSVQYALQDNAVPVYGYASRFADAYGQGRSLVQGQLTLNFVTEGYLFTVLQEYKKYLKTTQGGFPIGSPQVDVIAQVLGMMATRDNLLQQATNSINTAEVATITGVDPEIKAGQIQAQISQLMNAMTSDQITSLNNQLTRQVKTFNDVIGFDNAVYQDVLFDIRVELGNEATGVKRVRYIEKCKLISNEQVIAPDGQTLLDSYGFIGRRLR